MAPPPACTSIDLIGCFILQSLVRPIAVVHHKVLAQAQEQLAHGGVAIQINILMLDAAPKSFHKDVVIRPAPPVHADRDLLALEHPGEALTGELHPFAVLNTSGLPCTRKASSKQSTQNAASMLLRIRQLSTLLEYQSMMATKYVKPRSKGM
jgi:hypothetical protein